ncbi:MAG: CRISPR-associated endonuclease Cas1 [Candidatus Omnitrophica bacterium]|nr:CRISPR-associated endonuclease Cas1 [Candidatus Omnitrophota bacterium]
MKESKRLVVEKDDKVLLEIPDFKIERVFIFGNIQITTQAMKFLLESGIETSFFSFFGKLIGKLTPVESKNVYLRINQYEKHKDENFKLSIARTFVEGKIKNMKTILQKYTRNHPEINFSESFSGLDSCLIELQRKTQVSTIIGIEGKASAIYFECFGKMFRKGLAFTGRVRRPPADPINSLLSLGYSLITNEMLSVLSGIGFDVYIGYLHSLEYGRPSLALDLIEEFRQPIVDRLTLELINKEVLKEEDFEQKEGGVYLKDEPRKTYFRQYERRMQTEFQNLETGERTTYRKMFLHQAQKFAKTLTENLSYIPFQLK